MSWIRKFLGRRDDAKLRYEAEPHRELDQQVEEAKMQRHEAAQIRAEAERQGARIREHLQANNFGRRFAAAFAADDRRRGRHA